MLRTMEHQGPSLQEEDVSALEIALGNTLPEAFRKFLLRFNGGVPVPSFAPVEDMPNNPTLSIRRFFGLCQAYQCYDIESSYQVFSDRVGAEGIPIASTGTAQYFILHLAGLRQGEVWVWDQSIAWGKDPRDVPMYKSASSFAEFIESLRDDAA